MSQKVALTTGCPAGIGPEVTAAALDALAGDGEGDVEYVFFGHPSILQAGALARGLSCELEEDVVHLGVQAVRCTGGAAYLGEPGRPDADALQIQRRSILEAADAVKAGQVHALYTAPIRKAALDAIEGRAWPGHTELLGERLGKGADEVTMVFAGGPFLLALCTVHLPLREVSAAVTPARLRRALGHLADLCEALLEPTPSLQLAVLGLNPHAGEQGRLGREEQEVIEPTLRAWARKGVQLRGPLPADGFFAEVGRGRAEADGVLAMAHDQGLAPYKLLTGGAGVNLTAGLSVLRASPDHGTADAIAGQGVADADSAIAALRFAARAAAKSVQTA